MKHNWGPPTNGWVKIAKNRPKVVRFTCSRCGVVAFCGLKKLIVSGLTKDCYAPDKNGIIKYVYTMPKNFSSARKLLAADHKIPIGHLTYSKYIQHWGELACINDDEWVCYDIIT